MSKHLTVAQTVDLFEELKTTVQDLTAREAKLKRELSGRVDTAEKWHEKEFQSHEARWQAAMNELDATNAATRQKLQARFDERGKRLKKAIRSSQKQQTERIENEEGRLKYAVQKATLDTERSRAEGLKRTETALREFEDAVAADRDAFAKLEQSARKVLRAYSGPHTPPSDLSSDEHTLLHQSQDLRSRIQEDLTKFRRGIWPAIFAPLPVWMAVVLLLVCSVGLIPLLQHFGMKLRSPEEIAGAGLIPFALLLAGYFFGRQRAKPEAMKIGQALGLIHHMLDVSQQMAVARHRSETERIENEAKERLAALQQDWRTAVRQASQAREINPAKLEEKARRAGATLERLHRSRMESAQGAYDSEAVRLGAERESHRLQLADSRRQKIESWQNEYNAEWERLKTDWQERIQKILTVLEQANELARREFPAWNSPEWEQWRPPNSFLNAAKLGRLNFDVRTFLNPGGPPSDLRLPEPSALSLPLVLSYPIQGSVLFEVSKPGAHLAIESLNNIIFRLLASTPPGKLSFTIIDPVSLGQNFAALTHLADYEENLLNGRIWTEPGQIEDQLARLNEHMEKVIQMYLRNEYETIAAYNLDAGNIAEKYHYVVIADFPAGFSEAALRRLSRIAASGARCGVYTLIHWDHRQTSAPGFIPDDLRKSSVCIEVSGETCLLARPSAPKSNVTPDRPPTPEFATKFLHRVGEASRGSNRVEVPFSQVAPREGEFWTESTVEELRAPIGRSGATKMQFLALGRGTRQHALVAGKTGSGKSTLFHVIITNLALYCSPESVEFYLIDFKKGVEFKCYASRRLPHARVVAIESDREFGLSVLERLDQELRRRGDLFRQAGAQDLAGYKKSGGKEPMPRAILLIDEFQEFFVEDDRVSQGAAMLLDRIVRQGRAFGIHVVLGSQTLGGAYTLARTTIGQMVVRIALQCNEADAYLIMDENNAAPRLLSRPGEGIYNDMAGAVEGNSPFQAVWLPDQERDAWLQRIRALADSKSVEYPGPIIFEGNAPADVNENRLFAKLLEAPASPGVSPRIWLGAPNSIKGPTEVVFQRRAGNNLLIVGQRDEAILAMISNALLALAAQLPGGTGRLLLLDVSAPGTSEREYLDRVIASIPQGVTSARAGDIDEIIKSLGEELKQRSDGEENRPPTFVFIRGLQNFKKLRAEDEFSFSSGGEEGPSTAAIFNQLITEGPANDVHVIATVDTYNNVTRFLGRKTLSEFEMRVLFQMSANDSASLCDDPKASTLGLHRALLYNEHEGFIETFRPYALPGIEWVENVGRALRAGRGSV